MKEYAKIAVVALVAVWVVNRFTKNALIAHNATTKAAL